MEYLLNRHSDNQFIKSCRSMFEGLIPPTFITSTPTLFIQGRVISSCPFWNGQRYNAECSNQDLERLETNMNQAWGDEYVRVWNQILEGLVGDKKVFRSFQIQQQLGSHFLYLKDRIQSVSQSLVNLCFDPLIHSITDGLLDLMCEEIQVEDELARSTRELTNILKYFIEGYPTHELFVSWLKRRLHKDRSFHEAGHWLHCELKRNKILTAYQPLYLQYLCIQEMELYVAHGSEIPAINEAKEIEYHVPKTYFIGNKEEYPEVYTAVINSLVKGGAKESITGEWVSFSKKGGKPNRSRLADYIGSKSGQGNKYVDQQETVQYKPKTLTDTIFPRLDWKFVRREVKRRKQIHQVNIPD